MSTVMERAYEFQHIQPKGRANCWCHGSSPATSFNTSPTSKICVTERMDPSASTDDLLVSTRLGLENRARSYAVHSLIRFNTPSPRPGVQSSQFLVLGRFLCVSTRFSPKGRVQFHLRPFPPLSWSFQHVPVSRTGYNDASCTRPPVWDTFQHDLQPAGRPSLARSGRVPNTSRSQEPSTTRRHRIQLRFNMSQSQGPSAIRLARDGEQRPTRFNTFRPRTPSATFNHRPFVPTLRDFNTSRPQGPSTAFISTSTFGSSRFNTSQSQGSAQQ